MPMPSCAGVLGMARTTGCAGENAACNLPSRTPAAIDRMTVPGPASGATAGSTSGMVCGFTARTSTL